MEKRNVPKLRFKGFEDEWNREKLKKYIKKFIVPMRDKPKSFEGNIPWCRIEDIEGKYLHNTLSKKYVNEETIKAMNLKVFKTGTVICSCSANLGIAAITTRDLITNQTFIGLECNDTILNEFVYYRILTYKNKLNKLSSGTTIAYLSREEFENLIVKVPTLQEQEKIANFLSNIDKIIEEQDLKVKDLGLYKKGMMQKIFKQEIRFKDENGLDYPEWENYFLGDVCTMFSGGTPSSKNKSYYEGEISFIRSAEINEDSTELNINENALKNSSAKMINKGDLLYALYGATSGEVGISKISGAINQAILCIRSSKINSIYLANLLKYNKRKIIDTYIQGGQGNLSASIIKELNYDIPCLQEQTQIANFLSNIDNILEEEKKKLEDLRQFKKGLLQQMFV